jgi:hypothetical protein
MVNFERGGARAIALAWAGLPDRRVASPTFDRAVRWLLVLVIVALSLPWPAPVFAQATPNGYPLERCERGAFSTEEDFVMLEGTAYDGDPYVSDGDVLSLDGQVCARNQDLLAPFFVGRYTPDLGLDALDIIDIPHRLVAFSTELDDPDGGFTAGDLLFTNGAVIPNIALVAPFGVDYDIGLDGVQLMGEWENVRAFVEGIKGFGRGRFVEDPSLLKKLLAEYKVDIWFSIEQTFGPTDAPTLLNGDLLAATGAVIARQDALLGAGIPAGIPNRGVDFGLDAIATRRTLDVKAGLAGLRQSTEILFRGEPAFTDGDVLRLGGTVAQTNESLVKWFYPAATFLGLDALSLAQPIRNPDPMITHIGGESVGDIHEGVVLMGTGTGAFPSGTFQAGLSGGAPALPYRPFGSYIPIDGMLLADTTQFRVRYANIADGVPHTIRTQWTINEWTGDIYNPCAPTGSWGNSSDPDGWFDAAQYRAYRFTPATCPNTHLVLSVWNSKEGTNPFDGAPFDKDGHYIIWLEYRTLGGGATIFREAMDHHVQLDNTAPEIVSLELHKHSADPVNAPGQQVPPCGEGATGDTLYDVHAEIRDLWFDRFTVNVKGGNPPATATYSKSWYNPVDPTDQLDNQGTTPAGVQFIQTVNMNDLGASFVDCCYLLDMFAYETTIHHSFNGKLAQVIVAPYDYAFLTFAAAP